MHKSRLSNLIIDCKDADIDAAGRFWSQALGRPLSASDDDNYRSLADRAGQPHVHVQRVAHESRVHLDIETDDIEAEVARLEGLGARRIEKIQTWWVMEAPTGQRFCVVRPQRGALGADANEWP
jgi:glyoxalase superfamily protein